MSTTRRPTTTSSISTMLFFSAVLVAALASSARADDMAPAPSVPPLGASLVAECTDHGDPGVRWTAWNHTNGPHLFELRRNGKTDLTFKLDPGQSKTSRVSSHLWQGTLQHFEMHASGKARAALSQVLDCRPAIVDLWVNGDEPHAPCPGDVLLEVVNNGGEAATVKVAVDGAHVGTKHIHPHELIPTTVAVSAGQVITIHHDDQVLHTVTVGACGHTTLDTSGDGPGVSPPPPEDPVLHEPGPAQSTDAPAPDDDPDTLSQPTGPEEDLVEQEATTTSTTVATPRDTIERAVPEIAGGDQPEVERDALDDGDDEGGDTPPPPAAPLAIGGLALLAAAAGAVSALRRR
jgi:hypothetical protein